MHLVKLEPLKGKNAFRDLFAHGKRFGDTDCGATVVFRDPDAVPNQTVKIAVTISKKNAKRAVMRNRIKRLLRESVRQCAEDAQLSGSIIAIDRMIFIWKVPPEKPRLIGLSNVKPVVKRLLKRACDYYAKHIQTTSNNSGVSDEASADGVNKTL